ncbi:hypothetical protein EJ05DRAFT_438376 [Pseudovirgaria hyperparasitica]|uniref:RRM domain-containing protein n=1 Tax=Pseudovirgaria hyperparasitica TaxID=470096 RepID=A0A6A6WAB0_9PEZI|nr:uncharacterized protein EJ05DRAFT_438376 [Pseudovirgaria hyperparasitica]KAF2758527.1 hypothetical protein EJ05DRAFT_438376 [Pseudovirgaria hyperparasitica]
MRETSPEGHRAANHSKSDSRSAKKRRRTSDANDSAEELKIDLALPEPPSKKALRKAKKAKPAAEAASATKEDIAKVSVQECQKRTDHGIWIGNLPWGATIEGLRVFFTENSEIKDGDITRIHMPKPKKPSPTLRIKPNNSGFAYVDFVSEAKKLIAIELSETPIDGRNCLIKDAKSFVGRPEKSQTTQTEAVNKKSPNKRIFVGNLGFDITREALFEHFAPCGEVEDVFLATFEDSGKCRGYGWITFGDIPSAEAAVRGYGFKDVEQEAEPDEEQSDAKRKKKPKPRKWWVNKIEGRNLRCEFAEDKATRYKKRYGKDKSVQEDASY